MKSNTNMISMIAAALVALVGLITIIGIFVSENETAGVETAITATLWIFGIGIVLALASSVQGLIVNPAGLRNAAIGIAALGIIVLVSFLMADGGDHEKFGTDEETAYYVSAGMNAFYITGLLTLVSVLYSGVARIIK